MITRIFALALLAAGPALPPLMAQDTRTVNEPVFPPVCTVLQAQQAIVSNGPASETSPDTARIQAALTACGSGNAVELAGSGANYAFLSAPLNVPSGVSLIVDGGVTLFASRNREDFQTSAISASTDECGTQGPNGNGCKNFLLFNNNSTNVNSGLYGYGVIDGRGYATTLKAGADTGVSWWANADYIPSGYSQNNPILMKLSKSTNFTLYKITLRNSPEFHVGWSGTGFTAWGVKIQAPWTAHNTDGIDPVGSNVTITNSSVSVGDDQIAVGASSASSNVTVQNSTLYSGHGMSVGSYTQGGLTNMLVQNVNMAGQPGDGNEDGIRLKSAADRGGTLKNLTYQNICMRDVRRALYLTPIYNTNSGTLIPQFTNISFYNIHVLAPTSTYANIFSMQGYDANHISTVTLNNVVFDSLTAANVTPATTYTSFTLAGNVYPAFLQSLAGTGVTYTGAATANATPAYDCTTAGTFPYEVGELYLASTTATNLQTVSTTTAGSITLNAMLQPAKATQPYSGQVGSYAGAALMTQPVQFLEGTKQVGTASLSANGTLASVTLTGLAAGTHTYTAFYPGDANYAALSFGSVTVNVTQATLAATTTSLTYVPSPGSTYTYGSPITFTAKVSTASGTPSGSVRFLDGTSVLSTVALASGSASTTQSLAAGSHSITAVYLGDSAYGTSTSAAAAVPVVKASLTFTFAAAPTTVAFGGPTTFSGMLYPATGGVTPSGTITFNGTDGFTPYAVTTVNLDGNGAFTASFAPPRPGINYFTASYNGDANYNGVTANSNVTVTARAAAVVTLQANGGTYGTLTNLVTTTTAAPTPATTVVPTGTLTITEPAAPGSTYPGIAANGSTQILYPVGSHTIFAAYAGDTAFTAANSTSVSFAITQATPAVALASSATSVASGASFTLTATLTGPSKGAQPSGTVTFYDGATAIGKGNLTAFLTYSTATATATLSTAGAHSITAVYSGDTNYTAPTSTATTVSVTLGTSTTSLSLSSSTVTVGGSVTFTSSVSNNSGAVSTGSVVFANASGTLGTVTLSSAGSASLTLTESVVGTQSITASYTGSSTLATSASAAATLTVTAAPSFTLAVAPGTIPLGPGGSAAASATITSVNGFAGAVLVSCSSPVSYISCSPSSNTVNVSGTTGVMQALTISVASTVAASHGAPFELPRSTWLAALLPLFAFTRRGKRLQRGLVIAVLLALGTAGLSGCGSTTSSTSTPVKRPPTGVQTITVSASSGSLSMSSTISVNVTN